MFGWLAEQDPRLLWFVGLVTVGYCAALFAPYR